MSCIVGGLVLDSFGGGGSEEVEFAAATVELEEVLAGKVSPVFSLAFLPEARGLVLETSVFLFVFLD